MIEKQLPLFDRTTSIMGEGYRNLAAFKFEAAEQFFNDVRHSGQGNVEEVSRALHACNYWKALVEQNRDHPEACCTGTLHEELRRYPFGNVPGLHQLKEALLKYIADQLLTDGHFYIDGSNGQTAADLLLEIRHYKKAEKAVLRWIEQHPEDLESGFILAQIQWINGLKGEAKVNYTRALIHNPCRVPAHRILFEPLQRLIEDVGSEMAPSFGWVRGVLPLVPVQASPILCNESHHWAIECYRLLRSADRALKKRNMDACVEYRKELKAKAPDLYEEYYALLSGCNK